MVFFCRFHSQPPREIVTKNLITTTLFNFTAGKSPSAGNQSGFKLENGKLALSKIGEIPIKLHRKIKGKVKGVICQARTLGQVIRDISGGGELEPLPKTGKAVGIDVGIKRFLSLKNPRFYGRTLERIRIMQKQLSKKRRVQPTGEKLGSNSLAITKSS